MFKKGVDLSTLNADRPLRLAHHQWSLLLTAYCFLLVRRSSGTRGQSFNYIVSKTSQQKRKASRTVLVLGSAAASTLTSTPTPSWQQLPAGCHWDKLNSGCSVLTGGRLVRSDSTHVYAIPTGAFPNGRGTNQTGNVHFSPLVLWGWFFFSHLQLDLNSHASWCPNPNCAAPAQLPDNKLDQSMNAVARMEKQPVSPSETAQLAQLKLTSPVLMSDLTEVHEV